MFHGIKISYELFCFKCNRMADHELDSVNVHGINARCIICSDSKIFMLVGYRQGFSRVIIIPEKDLRKAFVNIKRIVKEGSLERLTTENVYGK